MLHWGEMRRAVSQSPHPEHVWTVTGQLPHCVPHQWTQKLQRPASPPLAGRGKGTSASCGGTEPNHAGGDDLWDLPPDKLSTASKPNPCMGLGPQFHRPIHLVYDYFQLLLLLWQEFHTFHSLSIYLLGTCSVTGWGSRVGEGTDAWSFEF